MNPYRVIALDLDGTLLRSDESISARTLDVLRRCRRDGFRLVIATGRSPRSKRVVPVEFRELPWVCYAGAEVYEDDRLLMRELMKPETSTRVIKAILGLAPEATVSMEQDGQMIANRPLEGAPTYRVANIVEAAGAPVTKILFSRTQIADVEALKASLPADSKLLFTCGGRLGEVTSARATKAHGLEFLLGRWGLAFKEVIAFGDDTNDVELIAESGLGVAMANACPELMAVADRMAPSCDEDGVAVVLEEVLAAQPSALPRAGRGQTPFPGSPDVGSNTVAGKPSQSPSLCTQRLSPQSSVLSTALDAVIFDLFGTLVDIFTKTDYHANLAEVGVALGIPTEEIERGWRGTASERAIGAIPTLAENLDRICRDAGAEVDAARVAEGVRLRSAFMRKCLTPRPDAVETLSRLRAAGFKVGLISDCSQEIPNLFRETALAPLILAPIFSPEAGLKKPDPHIYHLACERLGVIPETCLYVGDGDSHELSGAVGVGMHPVRIQVPYEDPDEAFRPNRDHWVGPGISALSEVLAIVG